MRKILFFLLMWPIVSLGQDSTTTKNKFELGSVTIESSDPYQKRTTKIDLGHITFSDNPRYFGGFGLGYNGYKVPAEYKFLEPQAKSIWCQPLGFEWGFADIIKNRLVVSTGLQLEVNNYRLKKKVTLIPEADSISYFESPYSIKKNKLVVVYLDVPLMLNLFVVDIDTSKDRSSVSLGIGVVGSTRIQSHTKQKSKEIGKDKVHDRFNLNPFKLEVMARIDFTYFSVFAKYSLYSMFKKGQGPDIHPFTVGITL